MRKFLGGVTGAVVALLVAVLYVLDLGIEERGGEQEGSPTVPSLIGTTPTVARSELEGLGLNADMKQPWWDDDPADDRIVSQTPAPGTEVERGASVVLKVR